MATRNGPQAFAASTSDFKWGWAGACASCAGAVSDGAQQYATLTVVRDFAREQGPDLPATADGLPHRLELQRDGAALVGDYVAEGNGIRRAVRAQPAIEG